MNHKLKIWLVLASIFAINSAPFAYCKSIFEGDQAKAIGAGQLEWSKYFPGKALFTDDLPYYESQMKIDHFNCSHGVRQILSLVQTYNLQVFNRNPGAADKIFGQIQEQINEGRKNGNECLQSFQGAYVVGASFLPYLLKDEPDVVDPSLFKANILWGIRDFYYLPYQNIMKAIFLFNRQKIGFLPDGNADGILGAYDCDSSKIFVSLDQRPHDLGSTLVHEMDHFYRDKFIPFEELKKQYPSQLKKVNDSEIDWRTYMLIDETLASTEATFSEEIVKYNFHEIPEGADETWFEKRDPYIAKDDFSFVSPDRPLEKFITSSHEFPHAVILQKMWVADQSGTFSDIHGTTRVDSNMQHYTASYITKKLELFNYLLAEVYEIISDGYFKSPLTASQKKLLSLNYRIEYHGDNTTWNKSDPPGLPSYIDDTAPDKQLINYNKDPSNRFTEPTGILVQMDTLATQREFKADNYFVSAGPLMVEFSRLDIELTKTSEQCTDFKKAVASGQLDGYLGTTLRSGNGAKTEDGDVRLGNGGKTGTDVKPGNGAKTSTTVRPCILPAEKL